ncbi:MAG: hypothetical protein P4L74_00155 [Candidatus Doudnabacteria bacterium]|nr:hypothetical protein [Candidatus Doudnabacteria bacterium]
MAFWNRESKPPVESLGALAGQKLDKKAEFDSSKATQENLSFGHEFVGTEVRTKNAEWLEGLSKDMAANAAQKAQITEGKVSKWLGAISSRLDKWATSMKERGQQAEQNRVAKAADQAVKKEQSVANMKGNVDYNRVISLNLNAPETAQTKSGKMETLFAAMDKAPAYINGKISKAQENLGNRMSLAKETMTQLHVMPRTEGERQVFSQTLEGDAKAFEQRRENIKGNLADLNEHRAESGTKVTVNVDADDLMILIRQAEAAGVPISIKGTEVGGTTRQQQQNEAAGREARAGLGQKTPEAGEEGVLDKAA